jgi:glutamine amidotransferase
MKNITIIDCGIGNRVSIKNMLQAGNANPTISSNADKILSADIIMLPGVGAFDAFMESLIEKNLLVVLESAVLKRKIPILGLCLGMQVLFESSAEGNLKGLGWIKGRVEPLRDLFVEKETVKFPHIGWKQVKVVPDGFISKENKFYFVHNYFCKPKDANIIAGSISIDDQPITVAVQHGNIYGVQFHPEKSHKYGLEFFKKFIQYVTL